VAVAVVASTIAAIASPATRLVLHAPQAQVAIETMAGLWALFSALVLILFARGEQRTRLGWCAAGLVTLAMGNIVCGALWPTVFNETSVPKAVAANLLVSTVAGALFVVGLLPACPIRVDHRAVGVGLIAVALAGTFNLALSPWAPLAGTDWIDRNVVAGRYPMDGLTTSHWALFAAPLALTVAASVGALWRVGETPWGGWFATALLVQAGAMLHEAFWPSAYTPVLTAGDLFRLAFAATIAFAGTLELRRLAREHEALLAAERIHAAALRELASLKGDYGRMVAHELASPITAIRAYIAILEAGRSSPDGFRRALTAIEAETDVLQSLAHDVGAIASIERDDFTVELRPTPLAGLLAAAAAYNQTLAGHHPLLTVIPANVEVLVDDARIIQVLRNLIGNAAKFCPPGTPLELRALEVGDRVRIEVVDHGPGVPAGEESMVFEKFGRGSRDRQGVPGFGLGLYLSRRIVRAHGGDLTLQPTPGGGATFALDLALTGAAAGAPERAEPSPGPNRDDPGFPLAR
jgi:signal transduction histidine kinase